MSLSPKDMDFLEAKNGAAREIALAFGVPPMLLGIPGDNTYANFQEANRAFWRGTVLPLVSRIAGALGNWLGPAFAGAEARRGLRDAQPTLRLSFDTDQVDALSSDREALWARVGAAEFLTVNEKRVAVGYGEIDGGEGIGPLAAKYSPDQPRVPAGNPDGGQWTPMGGVRVAPPSRELPREGDGPGITLAGGFTPEQRGMRVQDFVSAYCRGRISSVLPGQFLDKTIDEVAALARSGDAPARTCLKILGRDEYRK